MDDRYSQFDLEFWQVDCYRWKVGTIKTGPLKRGEFTSIQELQCFNPVQNQGRENVILSEYGFSFGFFTVLINL